MRPNFVMVVVITKRINHFAYLKTVFLAPLLSLLFLFRVYHYFGSDKTIEHKRRTPFNHLSVSVIRSMFGMPFSLFIYEPAILFPAWPRRPQLGGMPSSAAGMSHGRWPSHPNHFQILYRHWLSYECFPVKIVCRPIYPAVLPHRLDHMKTSMP